MPTYIRTVINGKVTPAEPRRDVDKLTRQLTQDTGVECFGVTLQAGYDPIGDPGNDRLSIVFADVVAEATMDASIAAFPVLSAAVSGTVAVTAGTTYVLHSQTVAVGEFWGFEIHLVAAFGNQAAFNMAMLDQYAGAYRRSAGNVQVLNPEGASPGTIPGLRLVVTSDATTVTIGLVCSRTGNLHIARSDVEIFGQGTIA